MNKKYVLSAKTACLLALLLFSAVGKGQYQSKAGNTFGQSANAYSNACTSSATGNSWTNPSYAKLSDGLYATTPILPISGQQSEYLTATNFGFSVPVASTITGVEVCVQAYTSRTPINITNVKLIKANVISGTSQNTPQSLTTTDSWYSFGSCTNLFGTTLTPSDVVNSGFGVAVSLSTTCCPLCAVAPSTTYINAIILTVHYNSDCTPITCSAVLPITLTHFDAHVSGQNVEVNWTTASQVNNKLFTVESSADGHTWKSVTTLPGAGTNSSNTAYAVTDLHPYTGISYYRLKQTDDDGTFTYSTIAEVEVNPFISNLLVYPNPATHTLYLKTGNDNNNTVNVKILDVTGRVVLNIPALLPQGGAVQINTYTLKNGIYIAETDNGNGISRATFIKQ